jgi:MFS family permease
MIPIFLQRVLGLTPLQAGLTIVPALIVSAFGGTLSGRLTDLFSPRVLIIVSLGLLVLVFNGNSGKGTLRAKKGYHGQIEFS